MDAPIFEQEVKKRTKKIETMLVSKFGASGRGLWEKLTSVENQIPPATVKKIKFLATVRNKLEHVDGYIFDGSQEQFLRTGDECIAVLEATEPLTITDKPNFPNPFNRLTDEFAEIQYNDAKPQARDLKTSLKSFNFRAQPKWLRITVYAIGLIIASNIVIQLGAFAGAHYAAQSESERTSNSSAPTPTKPTAPTPADVPTKKIDDYAGTYDALSCTFDFYNVGKQFFIKEQDGCGNQIYELVPVSATSFKFVKDIPYSPYNGTVDFISKNGKTSGLQITNRTERKFYRKVK